MLRSKQWSRRVSDTYNCCDVGAGSLGMETAAAVVVDDTGKTPKALLVTGIPLSSTGRGLHTTLVQSLGDLAASFGFDTKFDKNTHGHVRGGAAVLIFASSDAAAATLDSFTSRAMPVVFDGAELTFSFAAGKLRDHLFPMLPFEVRRVMQMDHTAAFSATDIGAAVAMATCLGAVLGRSSLTAVDCTAAAGGNTLGFMLASQRDGLTALLPDCTQSDLAYAHVTSIELDPGRFAQLSHNVGAVQAFTQGRKALVTLTNGCCFDILGAVEAQCDVVLFDPPWGGTEHRHDGDAAEDAFFRWRVASPQLWCGAGDGHAALPALAEALLAQRKASVVAFKLPRTSAGESAVAALLQTCVQTEGSPSWHSSAERPFPFRAFFGASTQLVFLVANDGVTLCNAGLHRMVARLRRWHARRDVDEHSPTFFDYDKKVGALEEVDRHRRRR